MLVIALTFTEQKSLHNSFESVETGSNNDFDYLIFRQIWPQSSCMFPGKNTCEIPSVVSTWVVHGLW